MAQVASESPKGYKIIATSSNDLVRSVVNSTNKLHFQLKSKQETSTVNNLFMVDRDKEQVIRLYKEASLLAICFTTDMIQSIATDVTQGILRRFEKDQKGIKILVLTNEPNCSEFVKEVLFDALLLLVDNDLDYCKRVTCNVEFVPTAIDRIVSKLTEKAVKSQFKKELRKLSIIDRNKFNNGKFGLRQYGKCKIKILNFDLYKKKIRRNSKLFNFKSTRNTKAYFIKRNLIKIIQSRKKVFILRHNQFHSSSTISFNATNRKPKRIRRNKKQMHKRPSQDPRVAQRLTRP